MNTKQLNALLSLDDTYFELVEPKRETEVESIFQRIVPIHAEKEPIAELLKKQDTYVIALLYDAYGATLYGHVLRIVLNRELAEQVIQDTFLKVWHHGAHYDASKGRLFTWLWNIARNTAIDAIRSSHFQNSKKTEQLDSLMCLPGGECLNPDTVGLQEIVKKMDEKHKVLIDLIYFHQYTHQEAADALDIPLGTVKSRVRYAISELKKAFEVAY